MTASGSPGTIFSPQDNFRSLFPRFNSKIFELGLRQTLMTMSGIPGTFHPPKRRIDLHLG
jgi:hypothetical protein